MEGRVQMVNFRIWIEKNNEGGIEIDNIGQCLIVSGTYNPSPLCSNPKPTISFCIRHLHHIVSPAATLWSPSRHRRHQLNCRLEPLSIHRHHCCRQHWRPTETAMKSQYNEEQKGCSGIVALLHCRVRLPPVMLCAAGETPPRSRSELWTTKNRLLKARIAG